MNSLFLIAILGIGQTYNIDDFYYVGPNKQPQALPLTNQILVDLTKTKRADVVEHVKKFTTEVKEINNKAWSSALVLDFKDSYVALEALNEMVARFTYVYPIVIYDSIRVVVGNKILIQFKDGAKSEEYLRRIKSVCDGDFNITKGEDNTYLLEVSNLKNPGNILRLAILIANDSFWVELARVEFLPFDFYINLTSYVETKSNTHLGEHRFVRLIIDVFTTDINVRKDLLPRLGNPIPFPGDAWFEAGQPIVTENDYGMGRRTITVDYPFIFIFYSDLPFMFEPLAVSFENKGKLDVIRTDNIMFMIKSITLNSTIEDVMPPKEDWSLSQINLTKTIDQNIFLKTVYNYGKYALAGIFIFFGLVFIIPSVMKVASYVVDKFTDIDAAARKRLWNELWRCTQLNFSSDSWRDDYERVTKVLNKVMIYEFGISLYSVDLLKCNDSFSRMINELNNLYRQRSVTVTCTPDIIVYGLKDFYESRKYD